MAGIRNVKLSAFLVTIYLLVVPVQAKYIIVAMDGGMYFYAGDGDNITSTTPSPDLTIIPNVDINSLDVNIAEGTVFFLDRKTQCIYRFWIDTSNVTTLRCGVSRSVYSTIAYDWVSGNMYWTDGFFNWIAVQPVDTTDTSMYRVLIQEDVVKPRALTLDPIAGLMFWFDLNPSGNRIERASLDGNDRSVLIFHSLISVHDIETDPLNERIYWTDAKKHTIESSTYSGTDRKIVYRRPNMLFRSISIDMNYVCMTYFNGQSWRCIHISTGDVKLTRSREFSSTSNPKLIAMFKPDMKPSSIDNCPLMGCDHLCVKRSSINTCICKEGYTMDPTGVNCTANNHLYGKGIFICNATNICMLDHRATANIKEPLLCLSHVIQDCRHMALDAVTGSIFYGDSVSNTINRYHLSTNVIGSLTTVTDVSGLAFDWTDDHLYWSETTTAKIQALSLTSNTVQTISQAVSPVSMVTVDPHSRSLFWIEDIGTSTMRIMYKSLSDSSSAQVLRQTSTSSIRSLYHDSTSDVLFFVDHNTLNTTTRNGSYATSFPFSMGNVNHMVLYKRYVIWEDGSGYLKSIPTQFFQQQQISLPTTFGPVMGMVVYDTALQQPTIGLCRYMNGGCEHTCFTRSTGGVTCACSYGFVLQSDRKSCSSVHQTEDFILAPDLATGVIYQVSMLDASVNALDISVAKRPLSAVFDHSSSSVYWAELTDGQLLRASLDGSNEEVVFTTADADSYPTYLALDSSTGNLYFSLTLGANAPSAGSIMVLHPSTGLSKTIVSDLRVVYGLVLFPSKGIMFYVNSNVSSYFIVRASMDGTNPRTVVSLPIARYTMLTIDYITEKLYWSGQHGVSFSDLDGQNQAVLFNDAKEILAIQIHQNYLFYTSSHLDKIVKYDLSIGAEVTFMPGNAEIGILYDTFIHPRPLQLETSQCSVNNGGCDMLCLPRETNTVSPCTCLNGINSQTDNPSVCGNNLYCDGGITNGILDSNCTYRVEVTCMFQCHPGYRSTIPTNSFTCMPDGMWDVDPRIVCEDKCQDTTETDSGRLWASCQRFINESCRYDCATGYTKRFDVIICEVGNVWSHSMAEWCSINTGALQQAAEEEVINSAYFGVAGAAGLLIVVFLAVVTLCFVKRKRFRKQMDTRRIPTRTTSTNQAVSLREDSQEFDVFSDIRNFQNSLGLSPERSLPESSETPYLNPHTWDTLSDVIHLEAPGESSDFGTATSRKEQSSNQIVFLLRQTSSISLENNITDQTKTIDSAKEEEEKASENIVDNRNDDLHAFEESSAVNSGTPVDKQTNANRTISKIQNPNVKPTMRRIASAAEMKDSMEPKKAAEKPPLRRTTSVATMQTVPEDPSMRRINSAMFTKSSRRRSSVVSSLGDQLNTRRSSEASLEKKFDGHSRQRRASVACMSSNADNYWNGRRYSTTSVHSLSSDRQGRRRSSVVSVKTAFGDQSDNSQHSSISELTDEQITRRSSVVPVEIVEFEDDVFE